MLHTKFMGEDAQTPSHPGEPCRLVGDCVPIDLYYEFLGAAPAKEVGGPRANVRTAGGAIYDVPMKMLTTAGPNDCPEHDYMHGHMIEIHVHGTREAIDPALVSKHKTDPAETRRRKERMKEFFDGRVRA